MPAPARVLFLKQTAPPRTYFIEMATDLAEALGPCEALTSETPPGSFGSLTVLRGPAYHRSSDISRLWAWGRYFVEALRVSFRTSRQTLLFIVAQPPLLPLIGYLRSLLFRQRYVVWVDDVYPDVLVRAGRLREDSAVAKVWGWLNKRVYGRASAVFTLGPCMAGLVQRYTARPVHVVPTWVDADGFPDVRKEENPFAREHGQVGKLTVLYSGNIGLTHDIETMFAAARRLEDRQDIGFTVVGAGPRYEEARRAARGLDNVTVLPLQPQEMLPFSLATGEVAVVSLGKGFEGVSMPSKTYHSMAARSAILGLSHAPNDLQGVIEQTDCGVNIEPGDVDGFVEAVLRFKDDAAYLDRCRRNSRAAAETRFSRRTNVERVLEIIRPLLPSDGHA